MVSCTASGVLTNNMFVHSKGETFPVCSVSQSCVSLLLGLFVIASCALVLLLVMMADWLTSIVTHSATSDQKDKQQWTECPACFMLYTENHTQFTLLGLHCSSTIICGSNLSEMANLMDTNVLVTYVWVFFKYYRVIPLSMHEEEISHVEYFRLHFTETGDRHRPVLPHSKEQIPISQAPLYRPASTYHMAYLPVTLACQLQEIDLLLLLLLT